MIFVFVNSTKVVSRFYFRCFVWYGCARYASIGEKNNTWKYYKMVRVFVNPADILMSYCFPWEHETGRSLASSGNLSGLKHAACTKLSGRTKHRLAKCNINGWYFHSGLLRVKIAINLSLSNSLCFFMIVAVLHAITRLSYMIWTNTLSLYFLTRLWL
jgi:hypothetical protein